MAHSAQVVSDQCVFFRDVELLALLSFVWGEVAEGRLDCGKAGRAVIERWRVDGPGWGPGTIELDLEAIRRDAQATCELVALLDATCVRLTELGDGVSGPALDRWCPVEGRFVDPYPARFIIDTILRLRGLTALPRST
jgi:hypothetical protein